MRARYLIMIPAFAAILSACNKEESLNGPATDSTAGFHSKYVPQKREYWITTEVNNKWDMVPEGVAMMTKDVIYKEMRYLYKTIRYVRTDSNWAKLPMPEWQQLSGPIIRATVGDSVIVHFKNGENTGIALSMHPHNLFYDEANEGVWRADRPEGWPEGGARRVGACSRGRISPTVGPRARRRSASALITAIPFGRRTKWRSG